MSVFSSLSFGGSTPQRWNSLHCGFSPVFKIQHKKHCRSWHLQCPSLYLDRDMHISVPWNKLTLAFIVLTSGDDLSSRGRIKESLVGQKCNCCVCKDVCLSQAENRMDMCLRGYLLCSVCARTFARCSRKTNQSVPRDPFSKTERHNHLIQIRKGQYTEEQRSRQIMSGDETISLWFPTFLFSPVQHITES